MGCTALLRGLVIGHARNVYSAKCDPSPRCTSQSRSAFFLSNTERYECSVGDQTELGDSISLVSKGLL